MYVLCRTLYTSFFASVPRENTFARKWLTSLSRNAYKTNRTYHSSYARTRISRMTIKSAVTNLETRKMESSRVGSRSFKSHTCRCNTYRSNWNDMLTFKLQGQKDHRVIGVEKSSCIWNRSKTREWLVNVITDMCVCRKPALQAYICMYILMNGIEKSCKLMR